MKYVTTSKCKEYVKKITGYLLRKLILAKLEKQQAATKDFSTFYLR